jgi:CRISPR-associated protein Csb1
VKSIVRAWNADILHSAAQFNSVRKTLDDESWEQLEKWAKEKKKRLADVGLDDAPAIFRKLKGEAAKEMPQYRDGSPNPNRRILGGVLVNGQIFRNVTVNLVALRRLEGSSKETTEAIRRYILALALLSATAEIDLFLREGCHLRPKGKDVWREVPRRGDPRPVDLCAGDAQDLLLKYARDAVKPFKKSWPELEYAFELTAAKDLISAATTEVAET